MTDNIAPALANPQMKNVTLKEPAAAQEQMIVIAPVDPTPVRSRFRIFVMMVGLCAAVFLPALNQTVVGTAIPTITNDLQSATGYAWISAAYLLAGAVSAPIWSKLSDIWGRKLILLSAVTFYFTFSTLCATSNSMKMLIISRSFQGVSGGGLIQIVYATISDIFSMRARTFYLGLLQIVWAAAGGLGPVVGGLLVEYSTWRWIFWMNLPIAALTFGILWVFLDVHNPRTKMIPGLKAVDWYGIAALLAFMVTLLLGLNFGGTMFPWSSPVVICLLVVGTLMVSVFALCERRAQRPLILVDLFKSKSSLATLIIGFTHDWCVFSVEFYLPLYFQAVKSASPLRSGYLIIPVTLMQSMVAICTGITVHRTGRYLEIIWVGVAFLVLGNGLYINMDATSPLGVIIAFQIIFATGTGLLFQPPLIALQSLVGPHKTAAATATLGLVRNLSTSIGIVVGGAIFSGGMNIRNSDLLARGLPKDLAENFSGSSAAASVLLVATVQDDELQRAVKTAFAESLQGVWILCTCMAACALIASIFVSRQTLSKTHVEHRTGLEDV